MKKKRKVSIEIRILRKIPFRMTLIYWVLHNSVAFKPKSDYLKFIAIAQ